jgi:hypothetical protein
MVLSSDTDTFCCRLKGLNRASDAFLMSSSTSRPLRAKMRRAVSSVIQPLTAQSAALVPAK